MKKIILSAFAFCIYAGAFAQILPPVNVWTPGGGNIFFNGGNVGIGLSSPLYPLHVNGNAFVSKGIFAGSIVTGFLKTDTLQTGVISVPTGVNNVRVGGGAIFNGNLFSNAITVFGIASSYGLAELFVDTTGNLTIARPLNPTSYASCTNTNPAWRIGGNTVGSRTGANIGTCDNYNFILKAGNVEHVWLTPDGKIGIGNSNPAYQLDVTGGARITGTLTAASVNINQAINSPRIVTSRITYPDTNGVHIGDSSVAIVTKPAVNGHPSYDEISSGFGSAAGRLSITTNSGAFSKPYGNNSIILSTGGSETNGTASMALGNNIKTTSTAVAAIVMGRGAGVGNPLVNSTPNSLAIGFNSTIPTLFVGASSGPNTTGNVGIGTANPLATLEITHVPSGSTFKILTNGTGDITSSTAFSPHFGPLSTDFFSIFQGAPGAGIQHFYIAGGSGSSFIRTTDATASNVAFKVINDPVVTNSYGGNDIFIVNNDGATKINTSSNNLANSPLIITSSTQSFGNGGTDHKLFEVTYRGAAYAREIFVQVTNFPDYVFKKDYKLMSLTDVEKYIVSKNHLPNIPSAKEVAETGQNVGLIQVLQMEKIEEMYLYMIEMKKEIHALQKENKELKKELKK